MSNPDVYKEKWFHGKISRDDVCEIIFRRVTKNYRLISG